MCSNCAGDYENPDLTNEEVEEQESDLTIQKCRELGYDVYMFSSRPEGVAHRTEFVSGMNSRVMGLFRETVHGFVLLCVAVGKRKDHGQTAKTVRQFIQEQ